MGVPACLRSSPPMSILFLCGFSACCSARSAWSPALAQPRSEALLPLSCHRIESAGTAVSQGPAPPPADPRLRPKNISGPLLVAGVPASHLVPVAGGAGRKRHRFPKSVTHLICKVTSHICAQADVRGPRFKARGRSGIPGMFSTEKGTGWRTVSDRRFPRGKVKGGEMDCQGSPSCRSQVPLQTSSDVFPGPTLPRTCYPQPPLTGVQPAAQPGHVCSYPLRAVSRGQSLNLNPGSRLLIPRFAHPPGQ